MHELQQILLKKLPRLGELTKGCMIQMENGVIHIADGYHDGAFVGIGSRIDGDVVFGDTIDVTSSDCKILGHHFTHADILKALGEDWAIQSGGQLWKYEKTDTGGGWTFVSPTWEEYPCLPDNISDLSLPEYEETRKQLIQLLTK